jgi:hypothetical protein
MKTLTYVGLSVGAIALGLAVYVVLLVRADPLGWRFDDQRGRVHSWYGDDGGLVILFTPLADDETVTASIAWVKQQRIPVSVVEAIDAPISDRALHAIVSLEELRTLNLQGCHEITNQGIAEIARLNSVRQLYLQGTGLSVGGLRPLVRLTGLEFLDVSGTSIDDDDVAPLLKLAKLQVLLTNDTKVSAPMETRIVDILGANGRR